MADARTPIATTPVEVHRFDMAGGFVRLAAYADVDLGRRTERLTVVGQLTANDDGTVTAELEEHEGLFSLRMSYASPELGGARLPLAQGVLAKDRPPPAPDQADDLDALLARAENTDDCYLCDELADTLRSLRADYHAALENLTRYVEGWEMDQHLDGRAEWFRRPVAGVDGEDVGPHPLTERQWRVFCDAAARATCPPDVSTIRQENP